MNVHRPDHLVVQSAYDLIYFLVRRKYRKPVGHNDWIDLDRAAAIISATLLFHIRWHLLSAEASRSIDVNVLHEQVWEAFLRHCQQGRMFRYVDALLDQIAEEAVFRVLSGLAAHSKDAALNLGFGS